MDQIKTYQKKDSFLKLENKKQDHETTVLVTKILQILENDKLLKLLNEKELEIINNAIKHDVPKSWFFTLQDELNYCDKEVYYDC